MTVSPESFTLIESAVNAMPTGATVGSLRGSTVTLVIAGAPVNL
ncbi:Uncharacterised protein [Mycobacterium tuberculosis]|nr:Uncharacterised protein [Mycobacterium tuberculosis]